MLFIEGSTASVLKREWVTSEANAKVKDEF